MRAQGTPPAPNPCLQCGACCAAFRVSFPNGEVDDLPGGWVPAAMVASLGPHRSCMLGTMAAPIRCGALKGEIGLEVGCVIYASRPSPCREFSPFSGSGQVDERCSEARAAHGLPPLSARGACE